MPDARCRFSGKKKRYPSLPPSHPTILVHSLPATSRARTGLGAVLIGRRIVSRSYTSDSFVGTRPYRFAIIARNICNDNLSGIFIPSCESRPSQRKNRFSGALSRLAWNFFSFILFYLFFFCISFFFAAHFSITRTWREPDKRRLREDGGRNGIAKSIQIFLSYPHPCRIGLSARDLKMQTVIDASYRSAREAKRVIFISVRLRINTVQIESIPSLTPSSINLIVFHLTKSISRIDRANESHIGRNRGTGETN